MPAGNIADDLSGVVSIVRAGSEIVAAGLLAAIEETRVSDLAGRERSARRLRTRVDIRAGADRRAAADRRIVLRLLVDRARVSGSGCAGAVFNAIEGDAPGLVATDVEGIATGVSAADGLVVSAG